MRVEPPRPALGDDARVPRISAFYGIVISMYYYLVIVKKMYINEPTDPSPLSISGPMKAVVYVGLAGTLILGIYPQPFIDWVVAATLMFSNVIDSTASMRPIVPLFGG